MRLAAQARCGFYPAPTEAVALALRYLRPPAKGTFAILDPCCGEAAALAQLGEGLGCPPALIHGIELDERRAAQAKAALPASPLLGPASFQGTAISYSSFSFVWCNPPFDDEIGGGKRHETDFTVRALRLLTKGGVFCLVCPENVLESEWDLQRVLLTWCHRLAVIPFPDGHRGFGEVITFGVKRDQPLPTQSVPHWTWGFGEGFVRRAAPAEPYLLPTSPGPARFEKSELTDQEMSSALAASPLRRHLEIVQARPPARPPLPLTTGHLALLLASGTLDGIVAPEGEPPHLVRGTARKSEYVSKVEETVDSKGEPDGTRTTFDQTIELVVRTLDQDGDLRTLTMGKGDADAGDCAQAG